MIKPQFLVIYKLVTLIEFQSVDTIDSVVAA